MIDLINSVDSDISKEEGTLIYNSFVAVAAELEQVYINLGLIEQNINIEKADREHLILKAKENNIKPFTATNAVWKAVFNIDVPLQVRFSAKELTYICIEKIEDKTYKLICEQKGTIGNIKQKELTSIEYLEGFENGELTILLTPACDEEETEAFRARYCSLIQKPSTSGNKHNYYNWAMECLGVGAVKVFPLALGPGTVKLVIADNDKRQASEELLKKVKEHIEEVQPIGATISVVSVQEKKISITANIKLKNGIVLGSVQEDFKQLLEEYFSQNSFDMTYVSIAKLGNILLETIGVEDYSDLKLNNQTGNISLEQEEVAVVGTVELGVI